VPSVKADPATKHIPVILVSSSIGWFENEDQTGTLGADGYLLIPFSAKTLADMVQDCSIGEFYTAFAGEKGTNGCD
jgi:hypothetical protein